MSHSRCAAMLMLAFFLLVSGTVSAGIDDGLVAYWPFSGNADDKTGHGHNGTVFGATLTSDRFDNPLSAYAFDGTAYISVPDSTSFPVAQNPFTVAAWMRLSSYSADSGYYLMGQSDGGGNTNKWIFFLGNTGISFICYPANGSHWTFLGTYDFQIDIWYHVAIRSDGASLTAFVNGASIGSAAARAIGDASSPFFMGTAEGGHPGRVFRGSLDDVRIYDRALSEAEILGLYTGESDVSGCLQLGGFAAAGRRVTLRQAGEPDQLTYTDHTGCYQFQSARHEKPVAIIIQSTWAPAMSPAGLQALSAAKNRVNIKWRYNATDADTFKVFRRKGISGAWRLLTTTHRDTLSFSDTTAIANDLINTYYYYVKACNGTGCSIATEPAGVPSAVTGLTLASSSGKISLTWSNTSAIETGFQIYRKDGACSIANPWRLMDQTASDATGYDDTTVASGIPYSYKVRAIFKSTSAPYAQGYGLFSNCQSVTGAESAGQTNLSY